MTSPGPGLITGAAGNLAAKLAARLAGRTRCVSLDHAGGDGVHAADLATPSPAGGVSSVLRVGN